MYAKQAEHRIQVSWGTWFRSHVGHKFRLRALEWLAAAQMAGLGLVLLHPAETFSISPSYAAMAMWGGEIEWGVLLTMVGFGGLTGLFINGSMEAVTPWIRATRALIGAIVFSMIAAGLAVSWLAYGNAPSTGLPVYWAIVIAEFTSIYHAITDARIYQNGRGRRNLTSDDS